MKLYLLKKSLKKQKFIKNFLKLQQDNRDLNYESYFSKGIKNKFTEDYTSENTSRLTVQKTIKLLRPIIQNSKYQLD